MILGLDFGTSGVRACLRQADDIEFYHLDYPSHAFLSQLSSTTQHSQSPQDWIAALTALLLQIPQHKRQKIAHIVLDATSSTVLLAQPHKDTAKPLTEALMYNDQRAKSQAIAIEQHLKKNLAQPLLNNPISTVLGPSSTLAKVLWLKQTLTDTANLGTQKPIICHQIDWINGYLTGQYQITDENNALKLGYNPITRSWPQWILEWLHPLKPPQVRPAGHFLATIRSKIAQQFQIPKHCRIYCGTTDSIAAFLATGAHQQGDAVTSLGTTLAIKQLSDRPIYQADAGIYSHRLKDLWLIGGASNTGGGVLLKYFEYNTLIEKLNKLIRQIKADQIKIPTGLDYYPLLRTGERFPIFDPNLAPKLTPKPNRSEIYLLGIIEGLVNIEKLAYQKLNSNKAPTNLKRIFSVGGGTKNPVWQYLRDKTLGQTFSAKMQTPQQTEAAFGATQLIL